jgi:hypothetical protein
MSKRFNVNILSLCKTWSKHLHEHDTWPSSKINYIIIEIPHYYNRARHNGALQRQLFGKLQTLTCNP